ncbi:lysoplasmalogenase [Cohnella sp. GCM10027633]|uniref:lysoplasmalogenase n=1 Tax=unclassified Cohnella TaxID=2636738 RepID=UPI00362C9F45
MSKIGLPLLILAMGALYIWFIPSDPEAVKLLFKLVPMALILLYAYTGIVARGRPERSQWLALTGLFFCMIGDGTLRWFVVGLSMFLIGHLFYIAAFFRHRQFTKLRTATIVPIALYAGYFGWQLVDALRQDGDTALIAPVLLYVTVIGLMAWTAILSGNRYAITGSMLFLASDTILSWNMFVSDISHSGVWIMTTYYGAQFLIASSLGTMRTRANLSIFGGSKGPKLKSV